MTEKQLGVRELYWLTGGISMSILPHTLHNPQWFIVLPFILIAWRLTCAIYHWPLPGPGHAVLKVIKLLTIAAGILGIYGYYHTLFGRDAGTTLLLLLAGSKVLESHIDRDFYVTTFLGFFIIITNFFYSQSIVTAVFMLLTLLVIIAGLITFNDPGKRQLPTARVVLGGQMILQALPMMLVLFLLFPRINGPLWGMPEDAVRGRMGVDDVLTPGSLSRLIQSNEVAFRVEFISGQPDNTALYWRGPVLTYTDGRAWRRRLNNLDPPAAIQFSGEPIEYIITLEPTDKRWLYVLEMPTATPDKAQLTEAYQVVTREAVKDRWRYLLRSYPDYRLETASWRELRRGLQLPRGYHPKTVALGREWANQADRPIDIINRALRWFNEEEFHYTLSPPLVPGDLIDGFLFNTRQGFCEHYAAAFAVLMRAAGIPARIVTGYQGGTYNPVGDYHIVYQRNAHAWAEVWLGDKGWVRVDPTSAVSPARVERGIESALPEAALDVPVVFSRNQFTRTLWLSLRNAWDNVNNRWNQWVISYGPQRQDNFLNRIGLTRHNVFLLVILMICLVLFLLTALALGLLKQYRAEKDAARELYNRFCRKLSRAGVKRLCHEGPLDFARRAGRKLHPFANTIDDITRLYIDVRYASQTEKLPQLKKRISGFRLHG